MTMRMTASSFDLRSALMGKMNHGGEGRRIQLWANRSL